MKRLLMGLVLVSLVLPGVVVAEESMPAPAATAEEATGMAPAATAEEAIGMAPAATAEEATGMAPADFAVARFLLSTGLDQREPIDMVETVPLDTPRVFAFLEATDIPADTDVTIVWYQGGVSVAEVVLPLKKSNRWRTYSSKNLGGIAGDWSVDLKDAQGNVLKTLAFRVQ